MPTITGKIQCPVQIHSCLMFVTVARGGHVSTFPSRHRWVSPARLSVSLTHCVSHRTFRYIHVDDVSDGIHGYKLMPAFAT